MAKKIGIQLYLDGASKFNSDIRNCDNSLKQFQSELKRTSEEFKGNENSLEALSKKSDSLQKAYDASAKKVEAYSKRLQELNKARDEEKQKVAELQKSLDEEKKKLAEIEQSTGKNSEAYRQQAKAVGDLEKNLKVAEGAVTRLDNQEVKLTTSLNNAATEQIKYASELDKTNKYLEEAEKSADGFAKSIDGAGKEIEETKGQSEKFGDTLETLAHIEAFEKISEGAKKVLESMKECVEVAERYEYAMAKVQSIAQVGTDEYNQMSDGIRNVAVQMGYSTGEIAEATYQAISASVSASEAVGFVADASKLARAGFTETTSAVDVLTTAINAYGKEANTTKHIADDLITTQNLGKTTVNELAQSLGTVIPTASALGVSLDQLSSMYVLMTKQGINTANATTYIRAMMNELSDSSKDVSKYLGELTGHTFGELMAQGYTLGDVMKILGDSVDGNSESFKNLFGNVRAGLGALSLYNQGADAFNETLQKMQDNAGATDKAFEIMADTAVMTNERFQASAENLQIAVGESLSPTIDEFKKKGIDVLNFFTEIAEENPGLVQALAGAAAGISAVAVAATAAAGAIAILRAGFGDITGVLQVAGAAGIVGGMAALALGADDAASAIAREADALAKAHETSEKASGDHIKNIAHVKELAERYKELASQTGITDEALEEQNLIVTELNATVPGLNLSYRDSKYAMEEMTDATDEYIDSLIRELAYQNNIEDITAAYKEQAEAERILQETSEELENAQKDLDEANELLKNGVTEAATAYDNAQSRLIELNEKQKEAQDIYDENAAKIEALSGSIEEYNKQNQEAEEKEQERALSLEEIKQKEEDLKKIHEEATSAISEQIGMFDEWNSKSEITYGKMIERWSGQTKGVQQYRDDLIYLKQVIEGDADPAIQDLASHMATMGVDGAAEIHNFVEGLKEIGNNQDKVKELAQTWQEHIDAISEAQGIYESILQEEAGYTEESQATFEAFYTGSEKAREDYNGNLVLLTEQGIQDQIKAVEENAPGLEDATQEMMDTSFERACTAIGMPTTGGTSTKFSQMGSDIVDSIVEGMNGGDTKIGNALGNLLQKATDNISVSGVASRINQKLGEQINREAGR